MNLNNQIWSRQKKENQKTKDNYTINEESE